MPIKYEKGGSDTGINQADSIGPVTDGESAVAAVFSRPSEALRNRTEAVRDFVDTEEMIRKAFTELEIVSPTNTSVTWDGAWDGVTATFGLPPGTTNSGVLTSTGDLILRPLGGPLTANFAAATFTSGADTYTVTSLVRAYQGGNKLVWKAVDSGRTSGLPVVVTVSGATDDITDNNGAPIGGSYIEADYIAGSTFSDLAAGIAANSTALQMVAVSYSISAAAFDTSPTYLSGGKDAFQLVITPTTLATFFSAADANRLQVGDILAINFSDDIGKLFRNADSSPSSSIGSSELFNSRASPEKLEYAVPVFAVSATSVSQGVLVEIGRASCRERV